WAHRHKGPDSKLRNRRAQSRWTNHYQKVRLCVANSSRAHRAAAVHRRWQSADRTARTDRSDQAATVSIGVLTPSPISFTRCHLASRRSHRTRSFSRLVLILQLLSPRRMTFTVRARSFPIFFSLIDSL